MFYNLAMARPPEGSAGGGGFAAFMPLVLMFFIIYFFIMRPQNKKQQEHQKMLSSLAKGDKVVTSGGIHGIITNVKDNIVTVKVDDSVKLDISKGNISIVVKDKK